VRKPESLIDAARLLLAVGLITPGVLLCVLAAWIAGGKPEDLFAILAKPPSE
jgi:hypothetical protein